MNWIESIIWVIISGLADSQGFYHSAKIWNSGTLRGDELLKSLLAFLIGISGYWMMVRSMNSAGIFSPELLTVLWFGSTIIFVSLLSGKFLQWPLIDQLIAIFVLFGIGWLLYRGG